MPGEQREVNYEGVIGCLDSSISILQTIDKRLNDELIMRQDQLFM